MKSSDIRPIGVTLANWREHPQSRWSFQHVREVLATAPISMPQEPDPLIIDAPEGIDIDPNLVFPGGYQGLYPLLTETYSDAMLVMHNGRSVGNWYADHFDPINPHILFSVSKSVTATVAGILQQKGLFDPNRAVGDYVDLPDHSAYADCIAQNVLDMNVALDFEENYNSDAVEYTRYRRATGWNPVDQTQTQEGTESMIVDIPKSQSEHGDAFRYRSPNSDMLGLLLERATGESFARLMAEHLWQPMGARGEAYVTVDYFGAPRTAGGICCTLGDLARLGQLIADNGRNCDGEQVLSTTWITEILEGGDRDAWIARDSMPDTFPDGKYRNKWYQVGDADQSIFAMGIHGQYLHVNPKRNVVVARLASHPVPVAQVDKKDIMDAMQLIAQQY